MSTPPALHYSLFPPELWENVLLRLTSHEILPLRILNREFRDLIDLSPAVQYQIDLSSSELEEGTVDASTPLNYRRRLLESYCSRWNYFHQAEEKSLTGPALADPEFVVEFGHIAYNVRSGPETTDIHFVRIPSRSTGAPQKEWVVRGIPGGGRHATHPPSNLLATLQVVNEGRSFQIHLLQMSDGTPHPEATCPIIPGPVFPPDTHTVEGELQVTGFRLAVRVLLLEPPAKSERLIVWDWRTGEKYMEILYLAHRVRAKFIDDYHLLTTAAAWVTTPRLWDTTVLAETLKTCTIEFGLGPDYKIDTTLGNPFYFNMESSHGVPFHEDTSKQLIGIRVVPRACSRPCSTLLLIRYGDLMKLASQIGKKPWIKWEAWRKFTLPVKFRPGVQEFGLLRSHLLIVCRDPKGSGTILYIYDFTVRSLRQRVKDKKVSDHLIPYTRRKFPLSAEGEPLGDFRFTEDNIFVLSGSVDGSTLLRVWTV